MKAAKSFIEHLKKHSDVTQIDEIRVDLYGSLAQTGRGHGTDKALFLGLAGYEPEHIDPQIIPTVIQQIKDQQSVVIDQQSIQFTRANGITFHHKATLAEHVNGMTFHALAQQKSLIQKTYFSIGGGFIVEKSEFNQAKQPTKQRSFAYSFDTAKSLLALCQQHHMSIAELMLAHEVTYQSKEEVQDQLWELWQVMAECIERGCNTQGVLPGGLKINRRAPELLQKIQAKSKDQDPLLPLEWVNLFAIAVNEENAAGGRVVTAPTNGAAGIIPAVLAYIDRFVRPLTQETVTNFLLTATAIGILFKTNASISGAEVGCQGEVGSACSMAAAGLTAVLGGTPYQIENAAEIGMEHNLGLTCDPVGGLVQIPCIERNAIASVKAINAAQLALNGDGQHKISLDKVIKTMWETGQDMQNKYKETAQGGLAVNMIEC